MKKLIINADDFGFSSVFNKKILELVREGLITSTTVMVNRVAEDQKEQLNELLELSETHSLSIGLHLDLKDSEFPPQIEDQVRKFKEFFKKSPSHLDFHKAPMFKTSRESYRKGAFSVIDRYCREKDLACRNHLGKIKGIKSPDHPAFYGSVKDFSEILDWVKLMKDNNTYEIIFHPGEYDPDCGSGFNKDREIDVTHIRKLNKILSENEIELISFLDL
jgi:chitin disaccharide deacetylase